jgi:hypothetical protein
MQSTKWTIVYSLSRVQLKIKAIQHFQLFADGQAKDTPLLKLLVHSHQLGVFVWFDGVPGCWVVPGPNDYTCPSISRACTTLSLSAHQ